MAWLTNMIFIMNVINCIYYFAMYIFSLQVFARVIQLTEQIKLERCFVFSNGNQMVLGCGVLTEVDFECTLRFTKIA